jgi:hypothetical protein
MPPPSLVLQVSARRSEMGTQHQPNRLQSQRIRHSIITLLLTAGVRGFLTPGTHTILSGDAENNLNIPAAPPLWSRGQSSWLQIQRSRVRVRFTELPYVLRSSGSGTGSTQTREICHADWPRGILYPQKLALTAPTSGGRSVGIVLWRTNATEFVVCLYQRLQRFYLLKDWKFLKMWDEGHTF